MLILSDLGGVVVEKGFWKLWDFVESEFSVDASKARTAFLETYKEFFSGQLEYQEFWDHFETALGLSQGSHFWHQKLVEFFVPQDKVLGIYDQLRAQGHTTALLSDQVTKLWVAIDKLHNISIHFDHVIISSETGLTKPDPAIYLHALEKCNGSLAKNSVFIDDREENLDPARELGMGVVLFTEPDKLQQDLSQILAAKS